MWTRKITAVRVIEAARIDARAAALSQTELSSRGSKPLAVLRNGEWLVGLPPGASGGGSVSVVCVVSVVGELGVGV